MALGEAKADILQGSWQGWDCKSADDEKHAPREPASTEQNILKKQSNRSSKVSPKYYLRKISSVY